jgi:hypothetical protein
MGIGIAFATGALKGWTETKRAMREAEIKKEEKEAEQQKFYQEQFFELAGKKDADSQALSQAAKLGGLEYDVTAANIINDVESSFGYNNLQFRKPSDKWDEHILPDNQMRAGGTWLRTMNGIVNNPEEQARMQRHFANNPQDLAAFENDVYKYGQYYIAGQRKTNPVTGDVESEYLHPADTFPALFDFTKRLKPPALGESKPEDQVTLNQQAALIEKQVQSGTIANPENAFVFTFFTNEGKRKEDAVEFSDQNQIDALGRIAANLNYGADKAGIQNFITNFSDVARAEDADSAYATLLSAVEMEQFGFGDLQRTMGGNQAMNQQFAGYIKEEFGGDHRAAVQAYAPLVKIKEDRTPMTVGTLKKRVELKKPKDYFKANGLNREQVIEQYSASQTALQQLKKLDELLAKDNTPTGLKAAMQQVGFGIFGEGGQLSQFFGSFETEDGTDAASLTEVAVRSGFLSPESAKNLSVIDSLKLSLAAQMARAVDPSGRLSNQDFEIQLRRLGQTGLFTSKPQARAGLGQVISDFEDNTRRLEVLHEVATVPAGEFTKREIRMLKADAVVRRIEKANYRPAAASPAAGEAPAAGEPKTGLVLDPSGYYTDGQGNFFTDEQGTKPASMEAVLKAIGMES